MPGKRGRKIAFGAVFLTILLVVGYWAFFVDMRHLPEGVLLSEHPSPTGEYVIKMYRCSGNATSADSIRGELLTGNSKKNLFWQYKESDAAVNWLSEYEVEINGISLDVRTDRYDWRREDGA